MRNLRDRRKLLVIYIYYIAIVLLILFSKNVTAQNTIWENISSRLPGDSLNQQFSDVFLVSPYLAWISSSALPEIYRTSDFGETWEIQTIQSPVNSIYLHEVESDVGFAGGTDGTVYRSTDWLGSWVYFGSVGSAINDIDIAYQYFDWLGYACGDSGAVWAITDIGLVNLFSGLEIDFEGICAETIDKVWMCGDSSVYFYDGNTFNNKFTSPVHLNSICQKYPSYVWVVGDSGYIAHSADSGKTWVEQSNPDTLKRALYDVHFVRSWGLGYGWAVGDKGVILRTTDYGDTWHLEADGLTSNKLRSVYFNQSSDYWGGYIGPGFIVGDNKTVLMNPLIVKVEDIDQKIDNFHLFQNYPNPFNPTTKIKFTISSVQTGHAPSVQLIVYDVLGNEVATLVNEEKPAGSYEVNFDATGLTSGIYFYQLKAGSFIQTKKMILLR